MRVHAFRGGWEPPRVAPLPGRTRTLVITGHHRSGTSLLAEYLERCGLFLGYNVSDRRRLPTGSLTGHHEDQQIVGFERAVLGKRRIDILPSDASGIPVRFTDLEVEEARRIIAGRPKDPLWAWKSQTTCLLLDAWDALLDRAAFVFLLRDPRQSADSLLRRNRDNHIAHDPTIGVRSWLIYNREILGFHRRNRARCRILELETLLASPKAVVDELNAAFGADLEPAEFGEVFEARALWRAVSDDLAPATARVPELFAEAVDLHQTLRAEGEGWCGSRS